MEMATQQMIYLGLPNDKDVLAAVGVLTIRHGQLDYVLRMTIKSSAGISIKEALDAATRQGAAELRQRVKKLAKQRLGECDALLKPEALLERARRASDKRNEFIHSLWAHELDGQPVMRSDDHTWKHVPTVAELESLAEEISSITSELNKARLEGFLFEALATKKSKTAILNF